MGVEIDDQIDDFRKLTRLFKEYLEESVNFVYDKILLDEYNIYEKHYGRYYKSKHLNKNEVLIQCSKDVYLHISKLLKICVPSFAPVFHEP